MDFLFGRTPGRGETSLTLTLTGTYEIARFAANMLRQQSDIADAAGRILRELRDRVSPQRFDPYLRQTQGERWFRDTLRDLEPVRDEYTYMWIGPDMVGHAVAQDVLEVAAKRTHCWRQDMTGGHVVPTEDGEGPRTWTWCPICWPSEAAADTPTQPPGPRHHADIVVTSNLL